MWCTGIGTLFWAPSSAIRGEGNINAKEIQSSLSFAFFTVAFIQIILQLLLRIIIIDSGLDGIKY